ncbi:MAG TPA: hypothetical protein VGO00_20745 [Kofleriaceae bacterium]|nr:hypothetical protein [Kofleriaceae bacterium]
MRVLLLFVLLGCARSHAPAWPKASTTAKDGGESLAPREARAVTAVEASPDETPSTASAEAVPSKPAASPGTPITPVAVPAVAAPSGAEDPLTTEEIVIEIDGND